MALSHPTILLWDIDGTLISGGGAGERALERTAREELGIEVSLADLDYHGRTDLRIGRMIFAYGKKDPSPEAITTFGQNYLQRLAEEMPRSSAARILPGIERILEHTRERAVNALLTGNLPEGRIIKLGHFNLNHHFVFGAFADHSEERDDLAWHALDLARQHVGGEIDLSRLVVIGDTPHDIRCGKLIGARTVAVATGSYSIAALAPHQPDLLLTDFSDPTSLDRFIS